ncbi:hypothetical protein BGZ57DRAFT_891572 [Hyaloscypha finlandica]|nr:hypothetical protein BGZ57DRAFT_891572 [Hyaloscypha finlandica]
MSNRPCLQLRLPLHQLITLSHALDNCPALHINLYTLHSSNVPFKKNCKQMIRQNHLGTFRDSNHGSWTHDLIILLYWISLFGALDLRYIFTTN